MRVLHRRSARVVVVDEVDDVLLILGMDPARPRVRFWYTPGGGIDPGEDARTAAVREAHEELGVVLDPEHLDGPHQREVVTFSFDGMTVHQDHEFYLVRVPRFEPRAMHLTDVERRSTLDIRWVPLDGIALLEDVVYPQTLTRLVRDFTARSRPDPA